MNIDQLVEKKIKTGLFQTLVFFRVCYLDLFSGIDITFTCIMIQILKKEFNLTFPYYTNLSSIFVSGVIVGNFICTYLADFTGPKNMIMGFSLLAFLSQISIAFSQQYNHLLFLRFLLGLAIGGAAPLPYVILGEIIEVRFKARFVYCLNFAYLTGKLYVIFLCYIFLKNFEDGNWRGLLLATSLPLLISFIATITLKETAAFLLHKERFNEAFQQIHQDCLQNNQPDLLSIEEQDDIKQWVTYQNQNKKKQKDGILSSKYALKTIQLWSILLISNNQIIAIHLLVPLLLNQSNQTFRELLIIAFFEALLIFLIFQSLDNKLWGGKRKLLLVTSSLTIIVNALMYLYRENSIILGSIVMQIVARNTLATTLVLTGLSYDSSIRANGTGVALGVGKLASIFCAPTFIYLNGIDPYLPFQYLGLLAVLQLFVVWTLNEN